MKTTHRALVWTATLFLTSLSASGAQAQAADEPRLHEDIELTRAAVELNRRTIVSNALNLTEQESEGFWPVYREYHAARAKLMDRTAKLLLTYSKDPANLSTREAEEMLIEFLNIRAGQYELKKQYVDKFKKVLPTIKMVRYYQVENKLGAAVQLRLAETVPLVW